MSSDNQAAGCTPVEKTQYSTIEDIFNNDPLAPKIAFDKTMTILGVVKAERLSSGASSLNNNKSSYSDIFTEQLEVTLSLTTNSRIRLGWAGTIYIHLASD